MILVDVQVPMLDQVFDFELNEEMEVEKVIKDISLLAAKQENLICKNGREMCLYVLGQEKLLERNISLRQQGVRAGDRLVLF